MILFNFEHFNNKAHLLRKGNLGSRLTQIVFRLEKIQARSIHSWFEVLCALFLLFSVKRFGINAWTYILFYVIFDLVGASDIPFRLIFKYPYWKKRISFDILIFNIGCLIISGRKNLDIIIIYITKGQRNQRGRGFGLRGPSKQG